MRQSEKQERKRNKDLTPHAYSLVAFRRLRLTEVSCMGSLHYHLSLTPLQYAGCTALHCACLLHLYVFVNRRDECNRVTFQLNERSSAHCCPTSHERLPRMKRNPKSERALIECQQSLLSEQDGDWTAAVSYPALSLSEGCPPGEPLMHMQLRHGTIGG